MALYFQGYALLTPDEPAAQPKKFFFDTGTKTRRRSGSGSGSDSVFPSKGSDDSPDVGYWVPNPIMGEYFCNRCKFHTFKKRDMLAHVERERIAQPNQGKADPPRYP